jgi:hypothetical protein
MFMTEEYWLRKEKKKIIVQKEFLWEMLASSSLIEFNPVPW